MACGADRQRASLGGDALSRAVTRGMPGLDLVDATESRQPCTPTAPGGGALSA